MFITPQQDYQILVSQLEYAFNSSSQFTLTQLWFYVHPTLHTLSLMYHLILELETAANASSELFLESDSSSFSGAEQRAREEALGARVNGLVLTHTTPTNPVRTFFRDGPLCKFIF